MAVNFSFFHTVQCFTENCSPYKFLQKFRQIESFTEELNRFHGNSWNYHTVIFPIDSLKFAEINAQYLFAIFTKVFEAHSAKN